MGYTPVPTEIPGPGWTAAEYVTYLKDNFAAGPPEIYTAKGDLFVGTGSDTGVVLPVGSNDQLLSVLASETSGLKWIADPISALVTAKGDALVGTAADTLGKTAVGSNGQVLEALSSTLSWQTTVAAMAKYKSGTSRTLSSLTIMNFETSVYDPDAAVTTGASWKYTVPSGKGGYYFVTALLTFQSHIMSYNDSYALYLYKNNAAYTIMSSHRTWSDSSSFTKSQLYVQGSTIISLAASDYIDVRVVGNGESTVADGDYNHIAIHKLSLR